LRRREMFKTIVVALDGSEGSKRAGALAADLAKAVEAKLVIAHVAEHTIGKGGGDLRADEEGLKREVQEHAEELSGSGIDVTVEVRDEMVGGPAHVIAEIAEQAGADLIVAGTRGHSPIGGLLLGSVTQRLLHIAECPVLAVPSSR
jgi:nucleotide-binding universal stress UspA family protein